MLFLREAQSGCLAEGDSEAVCAAVGILRASRLFSFVFWGLEADAATRSPAREADQGCGASRGRREACESAVDRPILNGTQKNLV